jgi:stringent starvation protein B
LPELSRRPYLLRAMHEWMVDCGNTPHAIVDATQAGVQVPAAFVKEGRIVLNVSPSATQSLLIGPECMEFSARFGGVSHYVRVPLNAVLGIYARETGEGMVFAEDTATPEGGPDGPQAPTPPPKAPEPPKRPALKVVK